MEKCTGVEKCTGEMQWGREEDHFLSFHSELYPPANTRTHVHKHTQRKASFLGKRGQVGKELEETDV